MIAVTVFDGDKARTLSFLKVLFDRGLIAFVAGSDPCRIRFLLPIGGFESVHVDEIMAVFESALSAFLTKKEAT